MTADRFTMSDVRREAAGLIQLAKAAGFDTEGWGVQRGTKSYSLTYRPAGQKDLLTQDIGNSAKIACGSIIMMMRGMVLMYGLSNNEIRIRVLKAALLASDRIHEHRSNCQTCLKHSRGNAEGWCESYKALLRTREAGLRLANAEPLPEDRLDRAIAV